MQGKIYSINISSKKGVRKLPINEAVLKEDFGILEDAHAGNAHRQVSLLSWESISSQANKDKSLMFKPGDYAENITTQGIDLSNLKLKDKIRIGERVILEVTQIGKACHKFCEIYKQVGNCIMPQQGIFTKVISGGIIQINNKIIKE